MKGLFLFIIFIPSAFSFESCFEQAFYNEGIYEPMKCMRNIRNLISKCKLYNEKAEVLYLYKNQFQNEKRLPLKPQFARSEVQNWGFHVVLRVGDQILDLDHTNSPEILDYRSYFSKMFIDEKSIEVRPIPVMDYLIYYRDQPEFYIKNSLDMLKDSLSLEAYLQ